MDTRFARVLDACRKGYEMFDTLIPARRSTKSKLSTDLLVGKITSKKRIK